MLFICHLCARLSDDGDTANSICMDCDDALCKRTVKGGLYFIRDNREHTFLSIFAAPSFTFSENPIHTTFFNDYEEAAIILKFLKTTMKRTKYQYVTIEFLPMREANTARAT